MKHDDKLRAAVVKACRAIERDGRLRTMLRRAARCKDVIGYKDADVFAQELQQCFETWRPGEDVADGAMILLAQRKVARLSVSEVLGDPPSGLLARLLGQKVGERSRLSELRFQRLIRAEGVDERLQQMRRALALLDVPVHPFAVVKAWLDLHNEQGRRRFARAYFTGFSSEEDVVVSEQVEVVS